MRLGERLARWWWTLRHPHVSYDNKLVRAQIDLSSETPGLTDQEFVIAFLCLCDVESAYVLADQAYGEIFQIGGPGGSYFVFTPTGALATWRL